MFYCESCGEERGWPLDDALPKSRGPCEICHKVAVCFDVPSGELPVPPRPHTTAPVKSSKKKSKKKSKSKPARPTTRRAATRRASKKRPRHERSVVPSKSKKAISEHTLLRPRHSELVDQAREMCRCLACRGGYPIGQFTISQQAAPTSCLASVVLDDLLRRDLVWAVDPARKKKRR